MNNFNFDFQDHLFSSGFVGQWTPYNIPTFGMNVEPANYDHLFISSVGSADPNTIFLSYPPYFSQGAFLEPIRFYFPSQQVVLKAPAPKRVFYTTVKAKYMGRLQPTFGFDNNDE